MVAGPGIEPGQEGYEPSELPLLKSRSNIMAPGAGFEPATDWLTANCTTIVLPGNIKWR